MKNKIKYGIIAVIALAVIGVISVAATRPPAVECLMLAESTLENTFNEMGEVIPLQEADLYSKTGGKLLTVAAIEGEPVKEGDILFVFDNSDLTNEEEGLLAEIAIIESQINAQVLALETQKKTLEAERASLQIHAEQALVQENKQLTDLQTARLLYENDVIPAQDLNNTQIAYEMSVKNTELLSTQQKYLAEQISSLNAQINDLRLEENPSSETGQNPRQQLPAQKAALEIQLNVLRAQQNELEIRAPQDGIIRNVCCKDGQIVPGAAKLCSVYQSGDYRIDCYIIVENTEGIKTGDEVEITVKMLDEDKVFTGNITGLAPDATDRVSNVGLSEKRVKIEISLPPDAGADIGPYWPVEIRFISAQAKNCLIVPKTALVEEMDDVWKVMAVKNGQAMEVVVERGVQTPAQVEIKGDLEPGDILIKNVKTNNISPGQKIRVIL